MMTTSTAMLRTPPFPPSLLHRPQASSSHQSSHFFPILCFCTSSHPRIINDAEKKIDFLPLQPKPKPTYNVLQQVSSHDKGNPDYDYDDDGDYEEEAEYFQQTSLHSKPKPNDDHEEEEDLQQETFQTNDELDDDDVVDYYDDDAPKPVVNFHSKSRPNYDNGNLQQITLQAKAALNDDDVPQQQASFSLSLSLREVGLSQEDSTFVSSNAPVTLQALVDASLELEELSIWTSQKKSEKKTNIDFYSKVLELCLADRGRWRCGALIESFGVGKQHISRITHVLSSQNIAGLMQKMRFLEDVLQDERDDGIVVRSRRMMREMSISPDDSLQKTLSFFEKMEARPGGISSLSNPRKALPYFIEEFPQAFCRDLNTDLRTLMTYFEEIGVPRNKLASIIMLYPSILFYNNIEELRNRLRTLKKEANVKPRDYGVMIVKYPWILSRGVEDNVKEVVEFLKITKVSPKSVRHSITKFPNLLGSSTRTLKAMAHQMVLIGLKAKKIGHVISQSPQLLLKTPRAFLEIVGFLESLGLNEDDMPKLLATSPSLFASTIPLLKTKIRFFHLLGIRDERMKLLLQKYPKALTMSVERSLKPRVWFLQSMGLSNKDIAFMICGFPPLLGYSVDHVLKPKFEILKNVLCHPVSDIVVYPRYFSYCVRRKILPRSRILKRSNVDVDLKAMLSKNDDEFAEEHLGVGRMLVPPLSS